MSFETLEFYIGIQYKTLLLIHLPLIYHTLIYHTLTYHTLIYCCSTRLSIRYCKHSICSGVS